MSGGTGLTCSGYGWVTLSSLAAFLSVAGFYMPIWLVGNLRNGETEVREASFGPFRRCTYPAADTQGNIYLVLQCGRYKTFDDIPSLWWKIVTLSTGVGCAMSLLVTFIAIPACICKDIISRTSALILGILQVLAGIVLTPFVIFPYSYKALKAIFIGIGCVLYPLGWDSKEIVDVCGPTVGPYLIGRCSVGWAYYMVVSGAVLLLVCASVSTRAGQPLKWSPVPSGLPAGDERFRYAFSPKTNAGHRYAPPNHMFKA